VPKEYTVFRAEIPIEGEEVVESETGSSSNLIFEVIGDQFICRPADRATRKFKFHLPDGI
jgi:Ribonuclease P/MRP, subunit p29